ncbi:MAG: hypothetical protein ACRYG5_10640 [Janthinobacterium lividum]
MMLAGGYVDARQTHGGKGFAVLDKCLNHYKAATMRLARVLHRSHLRKSRQAPIRRFTLARFVRTHMAALL